MLYTPDTGGVGGGLLVDQLLSKGISIYQPNMSALTRDALLPPTKYNHLHDVDGMTRHQFGSAISEIDG